MKLQLPKLLTTRPAFLQRKAAKPKPAMKLNAATATRMKPGVDDYDDEEPQTRLSSAFFVVLILHVVAVGGIYAFNSIKAHRKGLEPASASAKAVLEKPAAEPAAAAPRPKATASAEAPAKPAPAPVATAQVATAPVSNAKVYHVKANDTLSKIAASLNVSVAELQFVNSPKELATLRPGQIINVPTKKAVEHTATIEPPAPNPVAKKPTETAAKPVVAATAAPGNYEVQKGDTATSIAKRFGVTVDDLLKLNKVADPKKLQLGQPLKIPTKKN
ncbi:MAG: LysM peptidoglycan-binding domain-containing protein [Chthoniobacteraceae bacterium]